MGKIKATGISSQSCDKLQVQCTLDYLGVSGAARCMRNRETQII